MNLDEAIETRRSIRSYKEKSVSDEFIMKILECANLAPSAKNRQPWYFVVVKNEIKNKIADMMINYTIENNEDEECKKLNCPSSVSLTAIVIKEAPVLILVFKERDNNWIVGDNLSIGACIENMCLKAVDLGLGSLWIRDIVYVKEAVANLVNHPELELNSAVSIGYANESPKQIVRKKLENIIEWI